MKFDGINKSLVGYHLTLSHFRLANLALFLEKRTLWFVLMDQVARMIKKTSTQQIVD